MTARTNQGNPEKQLITQATKLQCEAANCKQKKSAHFVVIIDWALRCNQGGAKRSACNPEFQAGRPNAFLFREFTVIMSSKQKRERPGLRSFGWGREHLKRHFAGGNLQEPSQHWCAGSHCITSQDHSCTTNRTAQNVARALPEKLVRARRRDLSRRNLLFWRLLISLLRLCSVLSSSFKRSSLACVHNKEKGSEY